jgi:hypothetical protein
MSGAHNFTSARASRARNSASNRHCHQIRLRRLAPVLHRRAQLVELRTQAINSARGLVKSFGQRLPKCDADTLALI